MLLWVSYFIFWMSYYANYYPSLLYLFLMVGLHFVFNRCRFTSPAMYCFRAFCIVTATGFLSRCFLLLF
jgi:hypothetical protein